MQAASEEAGEVLAPSGTGPAPGRLAAIDQLRGFVVVLVVLHHSILAYCTFGHINRSSYSLSTAPIVDTARWAGFDVLVLLNDGFFMPLMFLLSGLFVHGSLVRKGPLPYLRARSLRLGLPFAVAELTVVPLAYYPSALQAGWRPGFARFWVETVTTGPWPSGPPWFAGVLLVFDMLACLASVLPSRSVRRALGRITGRPAACFSWLLAGSVLLYLPLLLLFGPARWLSVGPLAVQASRVLLYAAYFCAGVALGAWGRPGLARWAHAMSRQWVVWSLLALPMGAVFVATRAWHGVDVRGWPAWAVPVSSGCVLATYCAATCFAALALFLRFGGAAGPIWTSLAANSFAIFLLHYPVVTWIQSALLPASIGAVAKGTATFAAALAVSWTAAALLRRVPAAGRVI